MGKDHHYRSSWWGRRRLRVKASHMCTAVFLLLLLLWWARPAKVATPPLEFAGKSTEEENYLEEFEVSLSVESRGSPIATAAREQVLGPWQCRRALVAHEYVPFSNHHGADTRLLGVLESFLKLCSEVSFVSYVGYVIGANEGALPWELPKAQHIQSLQRRGVSVFASLPKRGLPGDATDVMESLIRQLEPELVCVPLWFWTWPLRPLWAQIVVKAHYRAKTKSPNTKRRSLLIVLSDDVHADRERERERTMPAPIEAEDSSNLAIQGNLFVGTLNQWTFVIDPAHREQAKAGLLSPCSDRTQRMMDLEASVYDAADAVLAITPEDRSRMISLQGAWRRRIVSDLRSDDNMQKSAGGDKITSRRFFALRPVVDIGKNRLKGRSSFVQRQNFLFVGSGKNAGNVQAIQWFLEYVWPKLRSRCGGARFVIVGAIPAGGA